MNKLTLDGLSLTTDDIFNIAYKKDFHVEISETSLKKMNLSRKYILELLEEDAPIYGINTGFGALSNKKIEKDKQKELQLNLVRSHCTGVGNFFPSEVSRAIMLIRANCLCSGHSGINPKIVDLLISFINEDIVPLIPEKGSVGASGDLAPLAQVALCLIGEGDVLFKNKKMNSLEAMKKINKTPAELGPKDGLSLINGTAVISALGALAIAEAEKIMKIADIATAMTIDGIKGSIKAFNPLISSLKPHLGQIQSSQNLNTLLKDSEILKSHSQCNKIQDPYSLRCVPQVHGACRQTLEHTKKVIVTEINSVTDNPLIFPKEKLVLSGGNFHGEAPALSLDYLAMGLSEIGSISERRIEKMMNSSFSELPAFLIKESGLNSGLMIAQVTAAALASENKGLCHPASIDSIPTSTDKEDHVSMGVTSGRKLYEIIKNVKTILAIEFLCNTQALEFQKPLKSSKIIEKIYTLIRKDVPEIKSDRVFNTDISKILSLINSDEILNLAMKQGKLL